MTPDTLLDLVFGFAIIALIVNAILVWDRIERLKPHCFEDKTEFSKESFNRLQSLVFSHSQTIATLEMKLSKRKK